MNRIIKQLAVECTSTADIFLFRSKHLNTLNLTNYHTKRMVNTLTVEELKKRSAQANDLIQNFKAIFIYLYYRKIYI